MSSREQRVWDQLTARAWIENFGYLGGVRGSFFALFGKQPDGLERVLDVPINVSTRVVIAQAWPKLSAWLFKFAHDGRLLRSHEFEERIIGLLERRDAPATFKLYDRELNNVSRHLYSAQKAYRSRVLEHGLKKRRGNAAHDWKTVK